MRKKFKSVRSCKNSIRSSNKHLENMRIVLKDTTKNNFSNKVMQEVVRSLEILREVEKETREEKKWIKLVKIYKNVKRKFVRLFKQQNKRKDI